MCVCVCVCACVCVLWVCGCVCVYVCLSRISKFINLVFSVPLWYMLVYVDRVSTEIKWALYYVIIKDLEEDYFTYNTYKFPTKEGKKIGNKLYNRLKKSKKLRIQEKS